MGGPDVNPGRLATGTSERRLRVLVVDDHEVVHWGLRLMLGEQPWVERCLSARNTEEALALARRYDPHVALVDLFVGQESGAEICAKLRALSPRINVLLISGAGRISPNAARAAGASGFISKDWPAADIAGAVRNAHKHAKTSKVEVSLDIKSGDTLVLDVINDGVRGKARQHGMGLKLAALEALQVGGIVEFGEREPGRWRVRLAVPLERS